MRDRNGWLLERRAVVERSYDEGAPSYDDGYDPATPVHRAFVKRLIETVPADGSVLEAACGTAPYAGMVLDAGLRYAGTDQSGGMLQRARTKWPSARFDRTGSQELTADGEFNAVMCIDAMENIAPEDWPTVLAAFRRALTPDGHAYLTVEEIAPKEIDEAFERSSADGLPVVHGEMVEGDTAGYHFYPTRAQVSDWLAVGGFEVIDEADEWLDGYGYHHLLLRVVNP